MSRVIYGAASLALIGALAGWYLYSSKPATPGAVPKGVEEVDFREWYPYTAPKGTFRVSFPRIPQNAVTKIVDQETQQPARLSTYYALDVNGVLYLINSIAYTKIDSQVDSKEERELLDKSIDEIVKSNGQNRLLERGEGKLRDHKTADFVIQNPSSMIFGRALRKGNHLYLLTMTTEAPEPDPKSFAFFINSFEPLNSEDE